MDSISHEEFSILYTKFQSSGQSAICLDIALYGLLVKDGPHWSEREACRNYLHNRKGPARKLLKQETDRGGLPGQILSQWSSLRLLFIRQYPGLASAFSSLKPCLKEQAPAGTDGERLYYSRFPSPEVFLHMVLHCLFLHFLPPSKEEEKVWDLACDLYVYHLMDRYFPRFLSPSLEERIKRYLERPDALKEEQNRETRAQILRRLTEELPLFTVQSLCGWLSEHPEVFSDWPSLFQKDSHRYWRTALREPSCLLALASCWRSRRNQASLKAGYEGKHRGKTSGSSGVSFSLQARPEYDYRRFLSRYAQPGEEVCLDFDSFDYIPYTFSRTYYENLVFLEPLEYSECYKLKELVIAIDTSGSCRGEIVKRFLEETGQILSSQENFFQKMRVHLIQCDSMIQGYTCITSLRQWNQMTSSFRVQGFGGTDFRPVFDLVETLRKQRKIQDLKGLIYFTDGDGIYPSAPPDYETAFVFLNRRLQKGKVPPWAFQLNLNLSLSQKKEQTWERSLV